MRSRSPAISLSNKKEPEFYESINLIFSKVATENKKNAFLGYVLGDPSFSHQTKKIVIPDEVFKEFNFKEGMNSFSIVYLVDINVCYNLNGSIGHFEIISYLDKEENKNQKNILFSSV